MLGFRVHRNTPYMKPAVATRMDENIRNPKHLETPLMVGEVILVVISAVFRPTCF